MKIIFFLVFFPLVAAGQSTGGGSVFNFLNLPVSPLQTAAGGINVSLLNGDAGFSQQQPALLHPSMSGQLTASFNNFFAGIRAYSASGAYHLKSLKADLAAHVYFLNYGQMQQTDAAGNQLGSFRPLDYVVQVSAAKSYLNNWRWGLSLKFIQSVYGQYRSAGLAADAGVLYISSDSLFSAGVVAKNMGVQLKTYSGEAEDLPFDLQAGITKKLAGAPFAFSFTAHHLQRFNMSYDDEQFNSNNGFPSTATTFNKLFNHFVFASHIYLGHHIEATIGYNHLRRTELNAANAENGLNGFSAGVRMKFQKLQILFARSAYQKNIAYNHFGLNIQLNQLGIGQ